MLFSPTFGRNFSLGTGPTATSGGANPTQVGLGAKTAGTQRNFGNGSIAGTGVLTDLAIEGQGMFIVEQAGERLYTRAGAFQRNERNDLVTIGGARVMGYGIDAQFNVVTGALSPLNIPVGTMTLAEATRNVVLNGNLNASGDLPTSGSMHNARAMFTDALLTPGNEMTGVEDMSMIGNDFYIDDGAGGIVPSRWRAASDAIVTLPAASRRAARTWAR